MGVFVEIWNPKNGPVTSIHDRQGRLKTPRLLLVDSGAFIHLCPKEEFPEIPFKTDDKKNAPGAVVADGRPLHFHGTKAMNFKTFGDYVRHQGEVLRLRRQPRDPVSRPVEEGQP